MGQGSPPTPSPAGTSSSKGMGKESRRDYILLIIDLVIDCL